MKRPSLSRSSGFTLVELLVVMAIIAVLAGLSIAGLHNAIIMANRVKCASHLRTIGTALTSYAADNNETYPPTSIMVPFPIGVTDPVTGLPSWMEQLDPYDGANRQLFVCPASPRPTVNDYYLSAWAAYYANGMKYPTPAENILHIKNSANMILAGDDTFGGYNVDADPDDAGSSNNPFNSPPWHGNRYNLLFVDGHVESVTGFDQTSMTNRYEGLGYTYDSTSP